MVRQADESDWIDSVTGDAPDPSMVAAAAEAVRTDAGFRERLLDAVLVRVLLPGPEESGPCRRARIALLSDPSRHPGGTEALRAHLAECPACTVVAEAAAGSARAPARRLRGGVIFVLAAVALILGILFLPEAGPPPPPSAVDRFLLATGMLASRVDPDLQAALQLLSQDPRWAGAAAAAGEELLHLVMSTEESRVAQAVATLDQLWNQSRPVGTPNSTPLLPEALMWELFEAAPASRRLRVLHYGRRAVDGARVCAEIREARLAADAPLVYRLLLLLGSESNGVDLPLLREMVAELPAHASDKHWIGTVLGIVRRVMPADAAVRSQIAQLDAPGVGDLVRAHAIYFRAVWLHEEQGFAQGRALAESLIPFITDPQSPANEYAAQVILRFADEALIATLANAPGYVITPKYMTRLQAAALKNAPPAPTAGQAETGSKLTSVGAASRSS
jgi:hypothetical protein